MAVRTTEDAVKLIIEYDTNLIPDLTPFIASASLLVDTVVAIDPAPSDAILEVVERYLTAHLIGITDPRIQAEQVKSLQATYAVRLSDGLGITHFGTLAMLFDTTGRLAQWNKQTVEGRSAVQFFWAGTEVT
jgi:hypothetical protein